MPKTRATVKLHKDRFSSFPLLHFDDHYGSDFDLVYEDSTCSFTLPLDVEAAQRLAHAIAYHAGSAPHDEREVNEIIAQAYGTLANIVADAAHTGGQLNSQGEADARAVMQRIEALANNIDGLTLVGRD